MKVFSQRLESAHGFTAKSNKELKVLPNWFLILLVLAVAKSNKELKAEFGAGVDDTLRFGKIQQGIESPEPAEVDYVALLQNPTRN